MIKHRIIIEAFFALLIGVLLYLSRDWNEILPVILIGYILLTFHTLNSRSIPAFIFLSILTSLTLSLRIPYLPWGDAWQDYAMIIRTLTIGYPDFWILHEPLLQVLISQPLMPAILALITWITHLDPLLIQKFLVPTIGATAPLILYLFAQESLSKKAAFYGAIFFLISTPFLHWVTQPVRETMAIPVLFFVLWQCDRFISSRRVSGLLLGIMGVVVLSPLHHFSSLLFLVSWYGLSLGKLVVLWDDDDIRIKAALSGGIFAGAFLYTSCWILMFNQPFTDAILGQVTTFLPMQSLTPFGLIIFLLIILCAPYFLFLFPAFFSRYIMLIKSVLPCEVQTYVRILQGIGIFALIVALFFISGFSTFKLNYPFTMLLSSIILFGLSLLGLSDVFTRKNFHIVSWLSVLGILFIIGTLKTSLVVDPLRILGYLFAPLCLTAGAGVTHLLSRFLCHQNASRFLIMGISIFCAMSLVFTFPTPVLLGFTAPIGHVLYDERQYTIAHPASEIEGIQWLSENHQNGTIFTDTNIYYSSLWITQDGTLQAEKEPDRLNPDQFKPGRNNYVLISERMFTTAKFGEWLYEKSTPVSVDEYLEVVSNSTLIYEKDGFQIFNGQYTT
jgi:hypothetical protein